MLGWFIRRWSIEVTFAEVRRHLGVETQRQWTDRAIARTTPMLLALFSLITLFTDDIHKARTIVVRSARWYAKEVVTFSDALAAVDDNYGQTRLSPRPDTTRPRRKLQMASSTA